MESTWNIIAIIGRVLCPLISFHVLFSMKSMSLSLPSFRGGGLTKKEFKLTKIFNGSIRYAQSSFLLSPLLPGAAHSDCLLCFPPTWDLVRAHRWSETQSWHSPEYMPYPRWSCTEDDRSPALRPTDFLPHWCRCSPDMWKWHQSVLCTLEIFLGKTLFSHFFFL